MTTETKRALLIASAAAGVLLVATSETRCACSPSAQCQLIRALCKLDVCVKADPAGWQACEDAPSQCDPDRCMTREECLDELLAQCAARMAPGMPGYERYRQCATLDCSTAPPPPPPAPPPDAATPCAGVMCGGACCSAHACFADKTCSCVPSPADCIPAGGGEDTPAITPSCCSTAPLCSAQDRVCCFVPATASAPAQTRCLAQCSSPSRECTFAPFLQADGQSSCLPPPYDTQGVLCPF